MTSLTRGSLIRNRSLAAAALLALASPLHPASTDSIVLLSEGQRRELVPVVHGGAELLAIEQVVAGLGVTTRTERGGASFTLAFKGREVTLYLKKSLASVSGDLRLLSAPVQFEGGRWLVPVDGIPRLLGPLLGLPVDWRAASRVLVLGNVDVPRITVNTFVSGDTVRVVLEASEKVPFRVAQEPTRVTVAIPRDLVDVPSPPERLTGGIVDLVQFVGGKENLFALTLGRRFQQVKAYEQDGPPRLVLEFHAAPLLSSPRVTAASPGPSPSDGRDAPAGPPIVVVDPGHGGEEVGAKGPAGSLEKDVTLSIARKLRAQLTNSLGYQVFLTRDRDQEVPLEERAAIANNYKADLFVSIHANASRFREAAGSEVYFLSYQASDEESRRMALSEGGEAPPASRSPGSSPDLNLILWDMAQAEHLEESSVLASRIQEELARVTGSEGRGIKQAPFRVLVGAAMPAVLVEVAFISHPEEERLLVSETFQNRVVAALSKGIARFTADHERRVGSR